MAEPAAGRLGELQPGPTGTVADRYWSDLLERFDAAAAGRLIQRDLVMAGLPIRMRIAGGPMAGAMFPAFDHLPVHTGAEPLRTVLSWDTGSSGVEPPAPIWARHDIGPMEEVTTMSKGPIRAVSDRNHGGLMVYDDRSRTLVLHAPDVDSYPWYERAAPLRAGLHWLLTGPQRHLMHAAAVGQGSRGVLIAGPGGSGKSTLAVACFDAGLDYAGDDYVVATIDGAPLAHSLYTTAKVDAESLARLSPREGALDNLDFQGEAKVVLDLRSDRTVATMPITGVVAPRLSGRPESRLEPIGGADALLALGPSSIVQLPMPRGAAFATAAHLTRSVPTWRLHLGEDLEAAVACMRELLSEETGP